MPKEEICWNHTCPNECTCKERQVKCQTSYWPHISPTVPYIDLSGSTLNGSFICNSHRPLLVYLNLSRTGITDQFCIFIDGPSLFSRLRILDLSGNNLQAIRRLNSNFPYLEVVHLEKNQIISIETPFTFRKLSLAANNISNIDFLPGIRNGESGGVISFTQNPIGNETIINQFNFMCYLEELDISFNKLSTFHDFGSCKSLNSVDLRHNLIKSLSYDSFNGMQDLKKIYLSHNMLTAVNIGDLRGLTKVYELHLDHNLISVIQPTSLSDLKQLSVLRLDYNRFTILENGSFFNLQHITSLNLSNNMLHEMNLDMLEDSKGLLNLDLQNNKISRILRTRDTMGELRNLNLEGNQIKDIQAGIFESLLKLRTLNLRRNNIVPHEDLFNGLGLLQSLYVDSFTICCFRPVSVHPENCVSPSDIFSSCINMIELGFLHIFIWFTSSFSIYGNIKSLTYRFRSCSWNNESRDILTANLNFSDLLMGIYLIIIAYEDLRTRSVYGQYHESWRKSLQCKVAGVVMTMSCQMSTLCIFAITCDRLIIFRYPFIDKQKTKKKATIAVIIMWLFSLTVSVLPELYNTYFGKDFYGKSSVCISLPLTHTSLTYKAWEYSFSLFIVLNLVIYCLIVAGQVAILRQIMSYGACGQAEAKRKREVVVAKSLSVVVISDTICWLPIAILGIMLCCNSTLEV